VTDKDLVVNKGIQKLADLMFEDIQIIDIFQYQSNETQKRLYNLKKQLQFDLFAKLIISQETPEVRQTQQVSCPESSVAGDAGEGVSVRRRGVHHFRSSAEDLHSEA